MGAKLKFSLSVLLTMFCSSCFVEKEHENPDSAHEPQSLADQNILVIPIRISSKSNVPASKRCINHILRNIVAFNIDISSDPGIDDGYFYLNHQHTGDDEISLLTKYPIEYDRKYEDEMCKLKDRILTIEYLYSRDSIKNETDASFVYRYKNSKSNRYYCVVPERESRSLMQSICNKAVNYKWGELDD